MRRLRKATRTSKKARKSANVDSKTIPHKHKQHKQSTPLEGKMSEPTTTHVVFFKKFLKFAGSVARKLITMLFNVLKKVVKKSKISTSKAEF
jgi:hypothetical protein